METNFEEIFVNRLISKSIKEERERNLALLAELNKLKIILKNSLKLNENSLEKNYKNFKDVLKKTKEDLSILDKELFKDSKIIQLKTNKMSLLVNELSKKFESEKEGFEYFKFLLNEDFEKIFGLKSVDLFRTRACFTPSVDNKFGNSDFTLLAMFYLFNISCTTKKSLSELFSAEKTLNPKLLLNDVGEFVNEKMLAFLHPLKMSDVDKEKIGKNDCSFCSKKESIFYTIGKGYQFGGYQYGEFAAPQIKHQKYGDHDCSSWICKQIGLTRISAGDITDIVKLIQLCKKDEELKKICEESKSLKELINKINDKKLKEKLPEDSKNFLTSFEEKIKKSVNLSSIDINRFEPKNIDNINSGDIVCWRTHTGLITEVKDDNVTFLAFSRDIPKKEGLGYETIEKKALNEKPDINFFSIRPKTLERQI